MENSNGWYIGGLVVVVLAIVGYVMWSSSNTPAPVTNTPGATTNDTTLTSNAADVRAAEEAYVRAQPVYTKTRALEGKNYVTTVNYNGATGFDPQIVYMNRGESIRFVNKSSDSMRISSVLVQGVPIYPSLGQEKSVGKGGTYSSSLSVPGVWSYYNLNGEAGMIGVVYVR